ncbi:Asp-tRNA(Asn)/Glu-tRNA(Gln) amidotransferase subunit GatB [Gammaproteobacteria bacterium]|nr:Asp-tRNA(Asn)/Glu-tRNA(Gln) amidotransferase subunit GatB [Gammaproteobacteria bacterium]
MKWETVIGLEVHVQLACESKIFSSSSTKYGMPQNTQASLVDLGYPGVLPVLNHQAVVMAIKFGLAVDAEIAEKSIFARKNYFYPDLPKGYQISQYELPIVFNGSIEIPINDKSMKTIRITRAHLEEDAGKSIHDKFDNASAIDLNRAGTPLLEIVSEPDLSSSEEASSYMQKIHQLVRYLKISDGNMQEGSFRCDANISLRPLGSNVLGTRAEIKNINSFKFVEKAIEFEVERQKAILEEGESVIQETRLYDSEKNETRSMRSKEEANDYRYFPDPDLLPILVEKDLIKEIKKELPELFDQKVDRYIKQYSIRKVDAIEIAKNVDIAEFFEDLIHHFKENYQQAANWLLSELMGYLNKENISITDLTITPDASAKLLQKIHENVVSTSMAKIILKQLIETNDSVDEIIETQGLKQISDSGQIEAIVMEVIELFPDQRDQYLSGKEQVLGFLIGQVMKKTSGKANPKMVNQILLEKINEYRRK